MIFCACFQILVTEINDIVERISDTCLENKTDDDDEEEITSARPTSRFKASRNKSKNH